MEIFEQKDRCAICTAGKEGEPGKVNIDAVVEKLKEEVKMRAF